MTRNFNYYNFTWVPSGGVSGVVDGCGDFSLYNTGVKTPNDNHAFMTAVAEEGYEEFFGKV